MRSLITELSQLVRHIEAAGPKEGLQILMMNADIFSRLTEMQSKLTHLPTEKTARP